jgi:hypothetical protein
MEMGGMVANDEAMARQDAEGKSIFSLDKVSPAVVDAYRIFANALEKKRD